MLRKLFKKSLLYFATLVFGKLLSAVFFMIVARILQPEKFGEITFFITIIQLVSVFADWGVKSWYQKKIAQGASEKILAALVSWRLLWWLMSGLSLVISNSCLHWFDPALLPFLIISLLAEAFFAVADAFYLAREQSLYLGGKLILRNVLLFWCLWRLHTPQDWWYFIWFYTAVDVITAALYFPWRQIKWQAFVHHQYWPKWSELYSYAVIDDLGVVYSRADSMAIEKMMGAAALGVYASAYRFVDAFNLLPQALFHNLFPLAAKEKLSRRQIGKMCLVMSGLGAVIALVLAVASEFLTVTLLGESYRSAGQLLRYFSVVVWMFFTNAPLNTIIQSSRQVRAYVPWLLIATFLNVMLNIIWIPGWGIFGSVASMVVAEGVLMLANCLMMRKMYAS